MTAESSCTKLHKTNKKWIKNFIEKNKSITIIVNESVTHSKFSTGDKERMWFSCAERKSKLNKGISLFKMRGDTEKSCTKWSCGWS